jgi:hypothetical protein
MKYKLTEDGKAIELKDGKPVAIDDDGEEFVIDALGASERVKTANQEAKKYRMEANAANEIASKYQPLVEADLDPDTALEAFKTVSTLDEKMKADMNKLKESINKTWQEKLDGKEEEIKTLKGSLYKTNVLAKFGTSKFAKKLIVPPDIAAEYFGKHFEADGTAKDDKGNEIYSKKNPGEKAGFDEALEILVSQRPDKDELMRGSGARGSGGHTGGSGSGEAGSSSSRDKISAGLKDRGIG